MKAFQSLFPPLSPHNLTLSSARRVVLVSYNADRETVDFRHYIIAVKPYGISKRVRRVVEGTLTKGSASSGVIDLGNERDVADFMLRKKGDIELGAGYESAASSTESVAGDEADTVNLADDYVGRNNKKGQKKAIRLDEVGPRMELRLVKIAEGVPGKEGKILYHHFVKKTKQEIAVLKADHVERARLKKERREEQERNVQRKMETSNAQEASNHDDDDVAVDEDRNNMAEESQSEWDDNESIIDSSHDEEEYNEPQVKKFRTETKTRKFDVSGT